MLAVAGSGAMLDEGFHVVVLSSFFVISLTMNDSLSMHCHTCDSLVMFWLLLVAVVAPGLMAWCWGGHVGWCAAGELGAVVSCASIILVATVTLGS